MSTAASSVTFTSVTATPGLSSTHTKAPSTSATSDRTHGYISSAQNSDRMEQTQSTTIGNTVTYAPPSGNSVNYLRFEPENGTAHSELGNARNNSVDSSTSTGFDSALQNASSAMKYKQDAGNASAVRLVQKPLLEAKDDDPRPISFQSRGRNPRGAARASESQCVPPARFSRVVDVDNVLSTVFSLQPMSLELIILTTEMPFVMRFDLNPMRDVGTTLRLLVEMHEVLEKQVRRFP